MKKAEVSSTVIELPDGVTLTRAANVMMISISKSLLTGLYVTEKDKVILEITIPEKDEHEDNT